MDEEAERAAFEEAAFLQYYLRGIKKTKNPLANAMQIHFVPAKQMDKADFLARWENGSYREHTLNPAWWAWKTRAAQAFAKPT